MDLQSIGTFIAGILTASTLAAAAIWKIIRDRNEQNRLNQNSVAEGWKAIANHTSALDLKFDKLLDANHKCETEKAVLQNDFNHLKEAHGELKKRVESLQPNNVASAIVVTLVTTPEGVITDSSNESSALLDWKATHLIGKDIATLLPGGFNQSDSVVSKLKAIKKDGSEISVLVSLIRTLAEVTITIYQEL